MNIYDIFKNGFPPVTITFKDRRKYLALDFGEFEIELAEFCEIIKNKFLDEEEFTSNVSLDFISQTSYLMTNYVNPETEFENKFFITLDDNFIQFDWIECDEFIREIKLKFITNSKMETIHTLYLIFATYFKLRQPIPWYQKLWNKFRAQ